MAVAERRSWRFILTAIKFLNRLGVKTLDYYAGALHGLVADLFDGDITQDQFLSFGYQLIEDQVTEAWFEGIGRNGFGTENMTSDWWDHLNGMIAREQDYFQGFADDIVSMSKQNGSLEAALSRADLYAQRYVDIENQAWLYSAAQSDTFVWAMGDTEEHCPECAALDGWVATAEEWQQSGINPQMPPNDVLTCGGWRCDCRLEKTEAPSMGDPNDALEAIKHMKGDVPGHEFHGNQWSGGTGTERGDIDAAGGGIVPNGESPREVYQSYHEALMKTAPQPDADQEYALDNYADGDYEDLNAGLRGEGVIRPGNSSTVKGLDSYLDNASLGENVIAYRGGELSQDDVDALQEMLDAGRSASFTDAGYMSTSLDWGMAKSFFHSHSEGAEEGNRAVFFKIHAPKGARAAPINVAESEGEYEILFARGSEFSVIGMHTVTIGNHEGTAIEMEYVGG